MNQSSSSDPVGQSADTNRTQITGCVDDSLRTRIARTTWISHRDRQLAQLGMKPSEYAADIPVPDWAYAIADAVIREMGLTRETQSLGDGAGGIHTNYKTGVTTSYLKPCTRQHRYVTEWTADD